MQQQSGEIVRIDLTSSQKDQIRAKTGHNADAIELTVQELEERIAPKVILNHNETFLRDA